MIGLAISLLMGLLVVLPLLGGRGAFARSPVLAIGLVSAAGLTLSGCFYWFVMLATGRSSPWLLLVSDAICLACCALFCFIVSKRIAPTATRAWQKTDGLKKEKHAARWHMLAGSLASVYVLLGGLVALRVPLGFWDAWGIWNLRARFLASETWQRAFDATMADSHLDYPLGHPLNVARLWLYDSLTWTNWDLTPRVLAVHWLLVMLGLIWATVNHLRGAKAAAVAMALFVCLSLPAQQVANQYADLPLATLMAMTLACVAMAMETRRLGWWFLAGLSLSGAMWTKNEGLAFGFACMTVLVAYRLLMQPRVWSWLGAMMLGGLPAGVALCLFKLTQDHDNDIVKSARMGDMLAMAMAPSRHAAVIRALWQHLGPWHLGPMLLPVVWLVVPWPRVRPGRSGVVLFACVILQSLFLYGAYVVTPNDLNWHVETSVNRLAMQLWPCMVLTAVLWRNNAPSQA